MYHSIQLTPDLATHFKDTACQDQIHKLPGPVVSKCWRKTKWLIIDEEGARWTVLHHRKEASSFADGVIWYSNDMAPVDLSELIARELKEEKVEEDGGWEMVEGEDISEGYVVVR